MRRFELMSKITPYVLRIALFLKIVTLLTCGAVRHVHASAIKSPVILHQNIEVRGRVVDQNGNGIAAAVIQIKDTRRTILSNAQGYFSFSSVDENAILIFTHLGFRPLEIRAGKDLGEIRMIEYSGQLNEVGIVSTGYQNIPKERATGSFVLIDSSLFNRKVSTNILDRLDGVTSGLIFNRNKTGNTPDISVRGRSTIASDANPLIILDNFLMMEISPTSTLRM
jgi:hypothetical protein